MSEKKVLFFSVLAILVCAVGCKEEVMQSHNQKRPEFPSLPPMPSVDPQRMPEFPSLPPMPSAAPFSRPSKPVMRRVDIFTCADAADEFRVEGEIAGQVGIEQAGSRLTVRELFGNQGVSFHARVYAPDVTVISIVGTMSLRVLDLCGGRLRVGSTGSSTIEITGQADTLALQSADSSVFKLEDVKLRTLEVNAAGFTRVKARGEVKHIDVQTAGSSGVDAFEMKAEHVSVNSFGSASIKVCVTGSLSARLSGSDEVVYDCEPANISRDLSGSSSLRAR